MNSTELKDRFRQDVEDQVEPFLWSDPEIYAYMDDAQKTFCRKIGGFGDATNPATTSLVYSPGTTWIDTNPLILKIRDAYLLNGRPVAVLNYEDLPASSIRLDGRTASAPEALIIGMEEDKARLYPTPTEAGTVQLLIDRLPLKAISDDDQKLEAASEHHEAFLMWMKHRAYDKQDAETYNPRASDDNRVKFFSYCEDAKKEKTRSRHKTRTVSYGGM